MASSADSNTLLDISSIKLLKGLKIALVATEWNERIVAEQVAGARRVATETEAAITHEIYVPGCVELPFACKALWETAARQPEEAPEALIAFGAVIRGGTPHFEYVCKMVAEGIGQLNLLLPVPVIFGVLTVDTELQAWERLGGGVHGHKGEEAMITALKMICMKRSLLQ